MTPTQPVVASDAGGSKDGIGRNNEPEAHAPLSETQSSHKLTPSTSPKNDNTQNLTGDFLGEAEDKVAIAANSEPTTKKKPDLPSAPSSPPREKLNSTKDASSEKDQ